MKLHAEIMPNDRKYYGTEIKLTTEDGREAYFVVWINEISNYDPSEREYDFVGDNGKFYVHLDNLHAEEYEVSDNHYETQAAYNICNKIVEALDGMKV